MFELSYHEDPPADWLLRIPEGGEELVARLGIGGGRIFCSGEGTHFIFMGWTNSISCEDMRLLCFHGGTVLFLH